MTVVLEVPAETSALRRLGALVTLAAALVYLPMLTGVGLGGALGGELDPGPALGTTELLAHNLLTGLVTVVAGLLSFGSLAAGSSLVASFINGFQMGVVISVSGAGALIAGMPHFLPETAAFVVFTAAGIVPAADAFDRLRGRPVDTVTSRRNTVLLTAIAALLLIPAAVLESLTA